MLAVDRLLDERLVGAHVLVGHLPARHRDPGCGAWVAGGPDDGLAELPLLHRIGTTGPDRLVGLGQIRVAQDRADLDRLAAGEVDLRRVGELSEALRILLRRVVEGLVDDEATLRDVLGGLEQLVERLRAVPVGGHLPGGGSPRHPHGETGVDDRVEVHLLAVLVEEDLVVEARRRGLAAVDRLDLAGLRVVVDEEPTTTDAGAVGLDDADGTGHGDRRVRGIASLLEHVDAHLADDGVDGGDRSTAAAHDRHLRQLVPGRGFAALGLLRLGGGPGREGERERPDGESADDDRRGASHDVHARRDPPHAHVEST